MIAPLKSARILSASIMAVRAVSTAEAPAVCPFPSAVVPLPILYFHAGSFLDGSGLKRGAAVPPASHEDFLDVSEVDITAELGRADAAGGRVFVCVVGFPTLLFSTGIGLEAPLFPIGAGESFRSHDSGGCDGCESSLCPSPS